MKNWTTKQKVYLGIGVGMLLLSAGLVTAKLIKDKKDGATK
jgi:hypothetical protein